MSLAFTAGQAVGHWLRERDEQRMIESFDIMAQRFGLEPLQNYVDGGQKHKHTIIHKLAKDKKSLVLDHLARLGFDLNAQRASDGCTALHLACFNRDAETARKLIQLGADQSIVNTYGEVAGELIAGEVSFKQSVQGAKTEGEILQLVANTPDITAVAAQDLAQAFFLLGTMSAEYDAVFCTFRHDDGAQQRLLGDDHFLILVGALRAQVLQSHSETCLSLWPTILAGLVKLPHPYLLESFEIKLADPSTLALLRQSSAELLVRLAWHFAKLGGDQRSMLRILARGISVRKDGIQDLSSRHVSQLLWSYGKAECRDEMLLVEIEGAVTGMENGSGIPEPQCLSNMAWATAKLHYTHTLHALCPMALRQMPQFKDQNVANFVWACARMRKIDSGIYNACFRRASVTLYDDQALRNHKRQSSLEFVMHWAQNYYAYAFIVSSTPEDHQRECLEGLSEEFLADLCGMHDRACNNEHRSFSTSSGLNSDRVLRELDRMIQYVRDVHVTHPESLETDAVAARDVTAANQEVSHALLRKKPICWLLEVSRSPEEYREALLQHPALEECRKALEASGFRPELDRGAKVFVHAWEYEAVVRYFEGNWDLKKFHIIVSPDFLYAVREVVASLPRSTKVSFKPRPAVKPKHTPSFETWGDVRVARTFVDVSAEAPTRAARTT